MRRTAVLSGGRSRKRTLVVARLFESKDPGKLGDEIEWPDDWPDTISVLFLEKKGFTVVRANLMGVITDEPE